MGDGSSCPLGSPAHGLGGINKHTKLLFIDFGKQGERKALYLRDSVLYYKLVMTLGVGSSQLAGVQAVVGIHSHQRR